MMLEDVELSGGTNRAARVSTVLVQCPVGTELRVLNQQSLFTRGDL